jgi:large subunit ribosomal protein L5
MTPMPKDKIVKTLMKELSISNVHAVPRVDRVVVNTGVGKKRDDAAYLTAVQNDLNAICGQRVHARVARQAVAGFNVRAGNLVGYRATLRGKRRDDFIERFVNVTLPRVRDFRGLDPKSLDGHGNLSVGLAEHLAFPEINPDKTDVIFGVEVTFVTTARTDAAGEALFRAMGFPLKERKPLTDEKDS